MIFSALIQAAVALAAVELEFSAGTAPPNFNTEQHLYSRFAPRDIGEVNSTLTPAYNFYYAKVQVGSPAQELQLLLDTGSPVSWIYGPNGSYNDAPKFYPNQSKTFFNVNQTFTAQYGSGYYIGSWASDSISVPQSAKTLNSTTTNLTQSTNETELATADDFLFGLVESFSTAAGAPGLLGLGPHIAGAGPSNYTNLPESLYDQNVTESPAFSIYLTEDAGRVVFGGIDLARVEYPIYDYDVITNVSQYKGFYSIQLSQLALDGENYDVYKPTILDTGSPMSLVPPGFVKKIGAQFNLTENTRYGTYYTTKNVSDFSGFVTFRLGHFTIDIPVQDLFVPGEYIWQNDGPANVTALSLVGSPNSVLGDAFFRHVYTIFDSRNNKVYLARRRYSEDDVSDISSLADGIPSIPGEAPLPDDDVTTIQVTQVATVTTSVGLMANLYQGPTITGFQKAAGSNSSSSTATGSSAAASSSAASASASSSSSSSSSSSGNSASSALISGLAVVLAIAAYTL